MSLNLYGIGGVEPPYVHSTCFNSCNIESFLYEILVDGALTLAPDNADFLKAEWIPTAAVPGLFNNQALLNFRTTSYVAANSPMVFSGFQITPPSYYTLSADKKTINIGLAGSYMMFATFGTSETDRASEFDAFNDGDVLPQFRCRFIPSKPAVTQPDNQFVTITTSCLFTVGPGPGFVQIKISPTGENTIENSSSLTIIRLA